jgi:anti-sigma factor RsiW
MRLPRGIVRGRRDPVCQEVVEMVTDYLEDVLARADRQRIDRHLAACPHCTEYLAQVRETISLVGRLTPEDMSPQMRDAFTGVYRRWRAGG